MKQIYEEERRADVKLMFLWKKKVIPHLIKYMRQKVGEFVAPVDGKLAIICNSVHGIS